jgi:hypothetical protein
MQGMNKKIQIFNEKSQTDSFYANAMNSQSDCHMGQKPKGEPPDIIYTLI